MKDIRGGRNAGEPRDDEPRFPRDTRRRCLGPWPWPRALAGTCLAATIAATMAGGIATGASALVLTPDPASATPAAGPGAPAAITGPAGTAQVTLSWAAPASDGGSPVSVYDVYAAASADFEGAAKVTVV